MVSRKASSCRMDRLSRLTQEVYSFTPVSFQKKKKRSVYLSGEANFTVAQNPDKPFIVSTGPLKVEVLGTKFNIESYPDNDRITTTLEHGSVKIYKNEAPEKSIIMKPDEQVIYNSQDRNIQYRLG